MLKCANRISGSVQTLTQQLKTHMKQGNRHPVGVFSEGNTHRVQLRVSLVRNMLGSFDSR